MLEKLNPKNVRALKFGAVGIAAMIVLLFVLDLKERWTETKALFEAMNTKLATLSTINITETKYAGLMNTVPLFKMPEEKEKQKFLFQDSLNEQLRKASINSQPWLEITGRSTPIAGHEVLRLKTSGKCNITQLFDLFVNLKENPYLICIEEIMVRCDAQNKQQIAFDITVSTPVKKTQQNSRGLL